MAKYLSKTATGQTPVVSLDDADVCGVPYRYTTEAALAAGDIIVLGPVEAGVRPYDVALITDDLDTNGTPTITLSVGILNADQSDLDADATSTWIAASTVGQTGGVARATTANAFLAGASSSSRMLGVKVVAGPATAAAAGKKMAVVLYGGA